MNRLDPYGLKLVQVTLPGLGEAYLDSSMIGIVNFFVFNAKEYGINVTFSGAFRDTEKQSTLNNSNSTTPGNSLHEAGYAVDINWRRIPENSRGLVVDAAAHAGLSWGGDFNKPDPVHFYMNPEGSRPDAIRDAQSTYKNLTCR